METAAHETFTTPDGATMAFTRHAPRGRDLPRLALVHSLALDGSIWDAVVERLATEADILTYDCRGHGRSERRATAFTVENFADDLSALLDRVGWDRATIAGCSMGGCVAQAFAGLHPSRAERLCLIDTTAWYGADAPSRWRKRASAARTNGLGSLVDFQLTRWFSDVFRARHPDAAAHATQVFLANDIECYAATCALLGAADLRPYLSSFTMPVAVVVGEDDHATPVAMARHLHESIPRSTLTILPRARHLTPVEASVEIATVLGELLRRA